MKIIERLLGKGEHKLQGEVFEPIISSLETQNGMVTVYFDPGTGQVYDMKFSSSQIKDEVERRGLGLDYSWGDTGIEAVHLRFQRTDDNLLNPKRFLRGLLSR